jgi:hypothetical protein
MNFRIDAAIAAVALMATISSANAQEMLITSPYTDISRYTNISGDYISQHRASAMPGLLQGSNNSTIKQTGNDNTASADVSAQAGSFYNNVTSQTQLGNGNKSTVDAAGNGNTLITNQVGGGNTALLTAVGDGNQLTANQLGAGNNSTVQFAGNGNNVTSTQIGTNLSYSVTRSANNASVSVTQIGVGRK